MLHNNSRQPNYARLLFCPLRAVSCPASSLLSDLSLGTPCHLYKYPSSSSLLPLNISSPRPMARPQSHPAMPVSYDPYCYYSPSSGHNDHFIHIACGSVRPASSYHTRPASIWSTSSVCSDDSSLDLALEDRAHDFDDDDLSVSPISPAESSSSRSSWSSMASSSSIMGDRTAPVQGRSESYKRSSTGKPRGPRPLPSLPISQPSSPYSTACSLPATLPIKVTPPLRLNIKNLNLRSPPPSYEEAISAGVQSVSLDPFPQHEFQRGSPDPFPFDRETEVDSTPIEFLTSPTEETTIDWERIAEFIAHFDG